METKVSRISLDTVGEGALPELFEREVNKVIQNIKDVNTPEDTKRKVQIEVTFEPLKDSGRARAAIDLKVKSQLAATKPVRSSMVIEGGTGYEQSVVKGEGEADVHSINEG